MIVQNPCAWCNSKSSELKSLCGWVGYPHTTLVFEDEHCRPKTLLGSDDCTVQSVLYYNYAFEKKIRNNSTE